MVGQADRVDGQRGDQEQYEQPVVVLSDAFVEPHAVMVKTLHTRFTSIAVLCLLISRDFADLAGVARAGVRPAAILGWGAYSILVESRFLRLKC